MEDLYHQQQELELLGGSWVVVSRVISRVAIVITYIRGLITPLITTHEPPSRPSSVRSDVPVDPGPEASIAVM